MFNLEKAIALWRCTLQYNRVFLKADLNELERHVRDQVLELVRQGMTEEEAFSQALQEMGTYGSVETEYQKVIWGKQRRQYKLKDEISWRISMLKNYLKITFRTLMRQKGYSTINIAGLAAGLATFLLIFLFVQHENSADKHHEKSDRIYRVTLSADFMDQTVHTQNTSMVLAPTLMAELPELESTLRVADYTRVLMSTEDKQFYEERFFLVDSTYFDIFTADLIKGDPRTALVLPNTMVITEAMAEKYFGDTNPIGEVLTVDQSTEYTITGVVQFRSDNSHFNADFLGSMVTHPLANSSTWLRNSWSTYVLLRPNADEAAVSSKLPSLVEKYVGPDIERTQGKTYEEAVAAGLRWEFVLEPLEDIYLISEVSDQFQASGDVRLVYILSAIALFILLIACINFVNLSTARSGSRAREVGLRKVLGSERSQLIRQFIGESIVMALCAMLLAIALMLLVVPFFENITGVSLQLTATVLASALGITLVTGFLSGLYPALVLSGFRPAVVLKGTFSTGSRGSLMRSSLVVFQFTISLVVLVSTGVVYKQLQYMQNRDLGFDKEQVVVLPIETMQAAAAFDTFRGELLKNPGIVDVAAANGLPGPNHIHQNTWFRAELQDEIQHVAKAQVSAEYVQTLGLNIIAGRDFSREYATDENAFLINEAAAGLFGWSPEEALGKRIAQSPGEDREESFEVIGVFQDAHFSSLHSLVNPLLLGNRVDFRYIPVRIRPENTTATLTHLEEAWTAFEPGFPFRYYFMDEDYQEYYAQEEKLGSLYTYFSFLSILIACLGLFGLAAYTAEQRTKEIGIRKVLGSSVISIVALLSKEFMVLVTIACGVAFPIAYIAMSKWLQDFAYATEIGATLFIVAGVATLGIALATIGMQTVRAARMNPVRALYHS